MHEYDRYLSVDCASGRGHVRYPSIDKLVAAMSVTPVWTVLLGAIATVTLVQTVPLGAATTVTPAWIEPLDAVTTVTLAWMYL